MGKIISMVTFWLLVLAFGPARPARPGPVPRVGGTPLASWFISWLNPLEPRGTVNWLMRQLFSVPEVSGRGTVWGVVNTLFHGAPLTFGWGDATLFYLLCLIPAFVVSFWDEVKEKVTVGGDSKKGLVARFVDEGIGELLWLPIKKLFK